MAKLPKYICFKVTSNSNGTGYSLKKVHSYELEETAHWKKCVEMAYIGSSVPTVGKSLYTQDTSKRYYQTIARIAVH